MAIRIVTTADGYTVFEKVMTIDTLEPLIITEPGKKYKQVSQLDINDKGQVIVDGAPITAHNYVFCSSKTKTYDGLAQPDPIQQDDPDESTDDGQVDSVNTNADETSDPNPINVSESDVSVDALAFNYCTARGLISKIGTYYINKDSVLIIPSETVAIVSTLPLSKAVDIISNLYANFPLALTPVTRSLKLKPFHSYNIANIWVEYVEESDLQMKSLDILAFDNGKLTKFGVNGKIVVPSSPPIDERFVSLKYKLDNGPISISVEGTPVVPVGQGVTIGKSIFDSILSAKDVDGITLPIYYDKGSFPVLSPAESVVFGILIDQLPNVNIYHEVYQDISKLKDDPELFVYVDEYVDMKIGQFIKRLNELEDAAIGSVFTVVKKIYDDRVKEMKDFFIKTVGSTSGIRRAYANSLRLKNPGNLTVTNDGKLSDNITFLDHEFNDYIYKYVNGSYKESTPCHMAQKLVDMDKTHLLSLMKIKWRENIGRYESRLRSYIFWKHSDYNEKNFKIYQTEDVNPSLIIHESFIGTSPVLNLTIDWPAITKWNSGRKCSQDENMSNLIKHIETEGKNTLIECLKTLYQYENDAFADFSDIKISTSIFNRSGGIPHDWYAFLESYPGYKDVNIKVRTNCTIVFKDMLVKEINLMNAELDWRSKQLFIDTIKSKKSVNSSWDVIFADKVESTLQTCLDTDTELNQILVELERFFLSNKRATLLVGFNGTYVDPRSKYAPFSLFGKFEGEVNTGFSSVLLDCLITYDNQRVTVRELLKQLNIGFSMDETNLVRDYRIHPSDVISDPTFSTGLLSYLYSDITI